MENNIDNIISYQNELQNLILQYYPTNKMEIDSNTEIIDFDLKQFSFENSDFKNENEFDIKSQFDEWLTMRKELGNLKLKIYKNHLFNLSCDVTDPKINEIRVNWCKQLLVHHKTILEYKNYLAWYLQQPTNSNIITMDYTYHKDFENLIEDIITIMNDVEKYSKNVEIGKNVYFEKSNSGILHLTEIVNRMKKSLTDIAALEDSIKTTANSHYEQLNLSEKPQ